MGCFAGFMERIVEADTHTLTINLAAASLRPARTPQRGPRRQAVQRLVARAQAAASRATTSPPTISRTCSSRSPACTARRRSGPDQLRARYLTMQLDALRAPGNLRSAATTVEQRAARTLAAEARPIAAADRSRSSAQLAVERADVVEQQVGGVVGGEVAAAVVPVPAARCCSWSRSANRRIDWKSVGEDRHAGRGGRRLGRRRLGVWASA